MFLVRLSLVVAGATCALGCGAPSSTPASVVINVPQDTPLVASEATYEIRSLSAGFRDGGVMPQGVRQFGGVEALWFASGEWPDADDYEIEFTVPLEGDVSCRGTTALRLPPRSWFVVVDCRAVPIPPLGFEEEGLEYVVGELIE